MKRTRLRVLAITSTLFLISSVLFIASRQSVAAEEIKPASSTTYLTERFTASGSVRSIAEAFAQAGVDYFMEDRVSAFPDPRMGLGSVITVERAMPITLVEGKRSFSLRTWRETVGDLLKEKGIELGDEDRISPTLSTPLQPNLSIVITRVARTEISEFEVIPFQTVERQDSTMWRGETKVTQVGVNGKRERRYLLIREDGELISKNLISNSIIESAVNKIVSIGTKLRVGRTRTGDATWYPFPNRWGTKVAVDFVPRGTEVRVTNTANGRSIIVRSEGCICGNGSAVIDLAPEYFTALGATLGQGRINGILVEEIL